MEESGEPLIGATVLLEGTASGTITNSEGIALFDNISNGKTGFVISFVGYEKY